VSSRSSSTVTAVLTYPYTALIETEGNGKHTACVLVIQLVQDNSREKSQSQALNVVCMSMWCF